MEIQQIKYFINVARYKSFTQAAAKLFVTQPMLTRVIKQLEAELGVKLIERTSKYFRLTDAGELFYQKAERFLLEYDDMFYSIKDLCCGRVGNVRLSIPSVLLDIYFPPILSQFKLEQPGVDISVTEGGSKMVANAVASGRADLGLAMLPLEEQDRFDVQVLISNVCQVAVNRNHPFAKLPSVHIRDLEHQSILTFSETATLHDMFISLCGEYGFTPRIAYKSLTHGFISSMIAMDQCIGVLPLPIIQQGLSGELVTIPLHPVIPWDIAIIRRREGYHSFASSKLYEFIRDYFSKLEYHSGSLHDGRGSAGRFPAVCAEINES